MERNSFIFYKGWREAIKDLPDDVRLEIYESIIEYATTGNLRGLKPMANIAFNFIKIDIDRDTEKYMSIVERNKSNGSKGGRPKSENPKEPKEPTKPTGLFGNPKEPTKPDNDNEYDNDYVDDVQTGYPKSSVVDVYTYIIEELENVIAAGAMEKSTALDGGGRISIESARALLAKTYLAAAWDLDKKDYFAKAAQVADDVIANRALVTPFEDLWRADCSGDDNEEFIWDVEYDYATAANTVSGGHPWSSFYCNHMGGQEDHGKGSTSAFIATLHALQCFEKGDIRYGVTFMKELPDIVTASAYWYWDWYKNGGTFIGIPLKRYYPAWYETEEDIDAWKALDPENRKNTWILPMSDHTRDPQEYMPGEIDYEEFVTYSYGGAPCRKFDDSNTASYSNKTDYRDVHIITLPEIYLVAAEAYLKAGDKGNALLRLNEVRRRARLDAVTEINVDVILKERACELFGQGSRWIDLRRTQKLVEYNDLYNPQIKGRAAQMIGKKLLRPIPQAAIDANELMSAEDQNPGY